MRINDFLAKWRAEQEQLGRYNQRVDPVALLDAVLKDAQDAFFGDQDEILGLRQAAEESGYHPDHLARLVRQGVLPDRRPAGHRGRLLFRRGDLPRRPAGRHTEATDEHEPACKGGPNGHS
ncbi:MAG: hypothetical protein IPJ95_18005 [Gemmatimonadetes bacterium]|nr:hypothetical protein [Gemmatimonadota bacterium]MBK7784547.1 hypothetical protein [Gemmatimonadota bacterium]MBK7925498.1 hypothetical protein [Gemmatimonadota bacterium]MBK9066224.1 hypothetical protein [Gemmatimonadota bacterium]